MIYRNHSNDLILLCLLNTLIYFIVKKHKNLFETVNKELHYVNGWFIANKLSLNAEKLNIYFFIGVVHATLIYINDFYLVSKFKNVIFSDDTNLFISDENLGELFQQMNKELKSVPTWFIDNKFSINTDKK